MKIHKHTKRGFLAFYSILTLALIISIAIKDIGIAAVIGSLLLSTGCAAIVYHEEKLEEVQRKKKFKELKTRRIIIQENE